MTILHEYRILTNGQWYVFEIRIGEQDDDKWKQPSQQTMSNEEKCEINAKKFLGAPCYRNFDPLYEVVAEQSTADNGHANDDHAPDCQRQKALGESEDTDA